MLKYGHDSGKCATRGSNTAKRRPVRQRVQCAGEQGGDADDQQPVRAAVADGPPRQVPEERDREHDRHGAGDQRPVGYPEKRGIRRFRRGWGSVVRGIAVQAGLHARQCDDGERAENDSGAGPSEPRCPLVVVGGCPARRSFGQRSVSAEAGDSEESLRMIMRPRP